MLSIFRKGVSSKIMLVILGIGLFAIVATGFGTGGMGGMGGLTGGGSTLASVGGEAIGARSVADRINRQLEQARQEQPELDIATLLRGGALEETVDQLIAQQAMLLFGKKQGLGASKRMIDGEIASIPAFRNLAGQFDEQAFRSLLQREGISEEQLRQDIEAGLIQQQLLLPVAASAKVPQAMAQQYASLLLEQRRGSVGLVPASAMGTGAQPNDQQITAFFRENQARYTIPERRVLRYAIFGNEQVAQAAQATPQEIEAFYRANAARYGPKETRTLSQLVLPDRAQAQALAGRIASGTSFTAAAQAAGFSAQDVAIGAQSREQFTDLSSAAVAQAVFAAAEGATVGPVQSPLGWHLVRVDGIRREGGTPLAAVRDEIATQLTQQKRQEALSELATRIEDGLADGATIEEIARREKLQVQETPPITATGVQFDNPQWRAPQLAPLLKTAFEMAPDEDPVVETLANGESYAILAVANMLPAAPPPLAQIKDRVKADLVSKRALDRARAVASSIVAKINAGVAPAQAFEQAQVDLPAVETVSARRLDIARPDQPVPPPLAMLFSLPRGKARILAAQNGQGWFVVHHAETTPGDAASSPGLIEATRGQFERILGEEYAAQFTRAVEAQMDIERNEDAIRELREQLQRGGAIQ